MLGAIVVYFIAMPVLIRFSIGLDATASAARAVPTIELMPKVSEYLSLIMTLIFGFGIVLPAARDVDAVGARRDS